MKTLRIVADENMPLVRELFSPFGEVRLRPGRQLDASDLAQADALLVRSVTRVDAALLEGTPVKFVGSATIGRDHVDQDWLAANGIAFANAPGCNANAVAEYVIGCLDHWRRLGAFDPVRQRIAVVGYGNVGKRLVRKLHALDWNVVVHDPPLLASGFAEASVPFVDRSSVLEADVISLHTPLTREGEYATWHWLDEHAFANGKFSLVINSCRGPVVDNRALARWLDASERHHAALDVWEEEPRIALDLLGRIDLATPHIAGYSLEGKTNGSFAVLAALCRHFGLEAPHAAGFRLASAGTLALSAEASTEQLLEALGAVYTPLDDDRRMRAALAQAEDIPHAFDQLRKNSPVRRELSSCTLSDPHAAQRWSAFF